MDWLCHYEYGRLYGERNIPGLAPRATAGRLSAYRHVSFTVWASRRCRSPRSRSRWWAQVRTAPGRCPRRGWQQSASPSGMWRVGRATRTRRRWVARFRFRRSWWLSDCRRRMCRWQRRLSGQRQSWPWLTAGSVATSITRCKHSPTKKPGNDTYHWLPKFITDCSQSTPQSWANHPYFRQCPDQ